MPPEGEDDLRIEAIIEAKNNAEKTLKDARKQIVDYTKGIKDAAKQAEDQVKQGVAQEKAFEGVQEAVKKAEEKVLEYNKALMGIEDASKKAVSSQKDLVEAAKRVGTIPGRVEAAKDVASGQASGGAGMLGTIANVAGIAILGKQVKAVDNFRKGVKAARGETSLLAKAIVFLSTTVGGMFSAFIGTMTSGVAKLTGWLSKGLIPALGLATKAVWGFTAALLLNPVVLALVAALVALVLIIKGLKLLFETFRDEINKFLFDTLGPFKDAWEDFKKEAIEPLLPILLILGTVFGILAKTLQFILLKIILPVFKLFLDNILGLLKFISESLMTFIDGFLGAIQPFVEHVFTAINAVRVAMGIWTNDNMTFTEKLKLFGKLIVAVFVASVKNIISLILELGRFLVKWPLDVGINLIGTLATHVGAPMVKAFAEVGKFVMGIFQNIANGFIGLINKVIDGINKMRAAIGKSALSHLDKFTFADKMVPSTEEIKRSIMAGVEATRAGVASSIDQIFDGMINGITGFIDSVAERFGVTMEQVAREAGVDLLQAPNLQKEFRKFMEVGIEKLREQMEELGDKIDRVNTRDATIEINPFFEVHITKDVDQETMNKRLGQAVDKALLNAIKGLPSDVFTVRL